MASSNSPYLGTALLQGLGKGAEAYAGEQQAEGNLEHTQAGNRGMNIENQQRAVDLGKSGIWTDNAGFDRVTTADGRSMLFATWLQKDKAGEHIPLVGEDAVRSSRKYLGETKTPDVYGGGAKIAGAPDAPVAPSAPVAPNAPGPAGGADNAGAPGPAGGTDGGGGSFLPTAKPLPPKTEEEAATAVGDKGRAIMADAQDRYMSNTKDYNTAKAGSQKLADQVSAEADFAKGQRSNVYALGDKLLSLPEEGFLKPDIAGDVTNRVGNYWNAAMDRFSKLYPDLAQYKFDEHDLGTKIAADKYSKGLAFLQAHGMGQQSLGGLQEAIGIVPSGGMTRDAAIQVLSGMAKGQQRAIDRDAYLNDWEKTSQHDNAGMPRWTAKDAMRAFEAEHGDRYGKEGAAFEKVLRIKHNTTKKSMFSDIYSGATPASEADKATGIKAMSRWFKNYSG
jgi:hypothetical protein